MIRKGQLQGVKKGDVEAKLPWLPSCLEWQPDWNEENPSRYSHLRHRFCNTTTLSGDLNV